VQSGDDETFGLHHQERANAAVGLRFGLSLFGDLDSASAEERRAALEAEKALDGVSAEVVRAHQDTNVQADLVRHANDEQQAAQEVLRLAQANLQAGTMTTLDVLHAESTLAQARLHYAAALSRYNQAQVNLLAALGLLREESLVAHG
jgi:outer membrane protein TolC